MAASKFSVQSFDLKHYAKTEAYARAVQALFDSATRDIMRMKQVGTFDPNKPFSWNDYPQAKAEMEKITLQLATRVVGVIERGSREEWLSSCKKNDAWLQSIMDTSKLSKEHLRQFQDRRLDALQAFQERKVGGLDLSQRVWKYVAQYKENLEDGIDLGLGKGTSADVLSREVRQYLRDPDMYFRRFRVKVGTDESGQTIYGRKWKRMVKTADGVRWIDEAPSDYHPGQGVYRSSYKNAMRLTRSEINMAYRESDWQHWQQLDFVVGFEIHRSNHEPQFKCKLCDRLTGRYPKNFRFIGWHPQCRCYVTPIIADRETFNSNELSDLKAALRGGTAQHQQAKNAVVKMPDNFTQWAEETAAKVAAGEMSIKSTPYFIRDNFTAGDIMQGVKPEVEQYNPLLSMSEAQSIVEMARKRHAARTQQEIDDIRQRAAERQKAIRDAETTQKRASNAINIASQFKDIDSAELQSVLDVVNSKSFYRPSEIAELKQATQNIIAQIKAQQTAEKALADLIPDVHDWHKQFTLAELQQTHAAIEKTFSRWTQNNDLKPSLEFIKRKLEYEISWMETKGTKYATWEISRNAYRERLELVKHRIDMLDIKESIKDRVSLLNASRSTAGKALVSEFDSLFSNDATDINILRQKADEIAKRAAAIEAQRQRALKKQNGGQFVPKSDAETRKDFEDYLKSVGASTSDPIVVDKGFVHLQGNQHRQIYSYNNIETSAERSQLWNHRASRMRWGAAGYIQTDNSFLINKDFRTLKIVGKIDKAVEARLRANGATDDDIKTINLLDKKISQFSLPFPILVTRYVKMDALQNILGTWATASTKTSMLNLVKKQMPSQSNAMSADPAYLSASTNELQNVFKSYPVKLQIEVPPKTPMYMSNNYAESEIVMGRSTKLEFVSTSIGTTAGHEHLIIRCRVVN